MVDFKTIVSIVKGMDIREVAQIAISLIGGLGKAIKPSYTVLIKPNFGVDLPSTTGATTNPLLVASLIEIVKETGAKRVLVGESSVVGYNAGKIFKQLGVDKVINNTGAELVNLDEDESVEVDVPYGKVLKKIKISRTAWESDFIISVPVMKTHFQTVVSRKFCKASLEGVQLHYSNLKLCMGQGCSGCRETTVLALAGLKPEEIAGLGNVELLIGKLAESKNFGEKRFLIGNCTNNLPYEGFHIKGCPPPGFYIKKCLKGEEHTIDW